MPTRYERDHVCHREQGRFPMHDILGTLLRQRALMQPRGASAPHLVRFHTERLRKRVTARKIIVYDERGGVWMPLAGRVVVVEGALAVLALPSTRTDHHGCGALRHT